MVGIESFVSKLTVPSVLGIFTDFREWDSGS